jgi:hypothetical protein
VTLNGPIPQQLTELVLAQASELTRFPERKHLLPIQGHSQFALELFFLPAFGKSQRVGNRAWNTELKVLRGGHCLNGVLRRGLACLNEPSLNWFFFLD